MWVALAQLDIIVGQMKLDDQFEWDIDNSSASPEMFAEVYARELGLGGEFRCVTFLFDGLALAGVLTVTQDGHRALHSGAGADVPKVALPRRASFGWHRGPGRRPAHVLPPFALLRLALDGPGVRVHAAAELPQRQRDRPQREGTRKGAQPPPQAQHARPPRHRAARPRAPQDVPHAGDRVPRNGPRRARARAGGRSADFEARGRGRGVCDDREHGRVGERDGRRHADAPDGDARARACAAEGEEAQGSVPAAEVSGLRHQRARARGAAHAVDSGGRVEASAAPRERPARGGGRAAGQQGDEGDHGEARQGARARGEGEGVRGRTAREYDRRRVALLELRLPRGHRNREAQGPAGRQVAVRDVR